MVRPGEHHILEKPQGTPGRGIDSKVMNGGIFFWILIVAGAMLVDKLHKDILVIQLPDTEIEFQKDIRPCKVAEEKAAIAVADEVLVISKLEVEIFPGIEIDGSAVVIIIHARLLECLVIARTRHTVELGDPVHHILRSPFLVVRKIGGKAQFPCDKPPDSYSFGIEKDAGLIPRLIRLRLLDDRVDGQEKILFVHLVEIGLILIECIPPGFFALKAVLAARDPFRIVHQKGLQVLSVYPGNMINIIVWVEFVHAVGQLRDTDCNTAADRFVRSYIQLPVPLLQDLHPVQKMLEFGALGQKSGLGRGMDGQPQNYQQSYKGFFKLQHSYWTTIFSLCIIT